MSRGLDGRHPDRLARAVLTWIADPGDAQLGAVLRHSSPAAVVTALTTGAAFGAGPAGAALDRARLRWAARLGDAPTVATLEAWQRDGIRLVCPGDPEWPGQLEVLGAARPWGLWVRGQADLRFACLRSVSIVGTRAATGYGLHVTAELAAALAERGWAVVSGGAFGIDSQAHVVARRRRRHRRGPAVRAALPVPARPSRPVRGRRRPEGAGQPAAAGPDADPARIPRAQPAHRRAQPRNVLAERHCAAGREHGPARPRPELPADGRAGPRDVHGLGGRHLIIRDSGAVCVTGVHDVFACLSFSPATWCRSARPPCPGTRCTRSP